MTALLAAGGAYVIVGGLPGLLYAGGVATAALFLALKLGVVLGGEGGWQRKKTIIAALRVELEERDQLIAELRNQQQREVENARTLQAAHEERIGHLELVRDRLQALVDDERARMAQFLGELTGGIGDRDDELVALERELAALVGD